MFPCWLMSFLVTVSAVNGLYPMESIIRNYEKEYGLVFDAPSMLEHHYFERRGQKKQQTSFKRNQHFDQKLSDFISNSVLQMAYNIGAEAMLDDNNDKHSVFSPVSIATVLSMLMLGSDGETHQQLMKLFSFDENPQIWKNLYEMYNQFGLLIEDLLSTSPKRVRPVDAWKKQKKRNSKTQQLFTRQSKIELANGIFIQKGFTLRQDYQDAVQSIYANSKIVDLDLKGDSRTAKKFINDWVKTKTNGKINEIITGDINGQTNMIIASTLYFQGFWENPFIKAATMDRAYYPNGRENPSILVPTMANIGNFPYYESDEYDCRIIGLPYKEGQTTMYIILPYDSNQEKIKELQKTLTPEKITEMISKLEIQSTILTFPKLHIQNSIHLREILNRLGLTSLFSSADSNLSQMFNDGPAAIIVDPNSNSNESPDQQFIFSRFGETSKDKNSPMMTQTGPGENVDRRIPKLRRRKNIGAGKRWKIRKDVTDLSALEDDHIFVDDILHKIDLNINEEGTEASAATASFFSRSDVDVEFRVDSPFIVLIRHDATRLPLFYGRIVDPSSA